MAKRSQQEFRRRTSHSKIETYDESYCQDAVARVVFNFSEPGEEILRKSRSMDISIIWGMFMAVTLESAVFMGKNLQDNQNSIVNTADLTLKQMFDLSSKLVAEQDEISGLDTIGWENIHGNTCH